MNQRLEALESKFAHLELTVEALNQVVYTQAKELDIAQAQISNLQGRLKEMSQAAQAEPHAAEDERPPHY